MYQKQAAFLRIILDSPGITNSEACRRYEAQNRDGSKHNMKTVIAMLEPVAPSGKHPGRAAYVVRKQVPAMVTAFGLFVTPEGAAALAKHEERAGKPPPKGFMYKGSPTPTRFVDGLGAPAMVGPVIELDEHGKQQYAAPHEPAKRNDLSLLHIRTALRQARSAHDKIVDSRGGPQVLVDLRADATIRALDLLVDKLYGSK